MHHRLLTGLSAAVCAASCALGGCTDASEPRPIATLHAAVVNGELSDEDEDEVVDIYARVSDSDILHCTGTLIAPDVVVTAQHCVTYRDDPNATFTCHPDGSLTTSTPGAGSLGATVPPEEIQVFFGVTHDLEPDAIGARVFGSGSTQICRGDIAVVVLDRELGEKLAPVRLGQGVKLGERVKVVGYGETEAAQSGSRHRRAGGRVLDIGPNPFGAGSGTAAPNTFVLGEGACHGDSGGPALSEATGALVGVYSLSAAISCTSIGVRNAFTSVPPFEDLIREALEFAGREPVIEPLPDAGTSDDAGPDEDAGPDDDAGSGDDDDAGSSDDDAGNGNGDDDAGSGDDDAGNGNGDDDSGNESGSGSRRDPSCGCRAPGGHGSGPFGLSLLFAVALAIRVWARRGCPDRGCGPVS